jgi:hypothetical protein
MVVYVLIFTFLESGRKTRDSIKRNDSKNSSNLICC